MQMILIILWDMFQNTITDHYITILSFNKNGLVKLKNNIADEKKIDSL